MISCYSTINTIHALNLIRAYYYDAMPDSSDRERHDKQNAYLQTIKDSEVFEVRLGRLKMDGRGEPRQKGVDTLIAIDMLSKAYEDHYDIGILVAGDDDFLDVVKSVKDAGKRVYGAYFERNISPDLKDSFDKRKPLDSVILEAMRKR